MQGDNYKAGVAGGIRKPVLAGRQEAGRAIFMTGRYIGNFPHGVRGIGYSQRFRNALYRAGG